MYLIFSNPTPYSSDGSTSFPDLENLQGKEVLPLEEKFEKLKTKKQ